MHFFSRLLVLFTCLITTSALPQDLKQSKGAKPNFRHHARLALMNGLASGLASTCSKTVLHPFDAVKTLQQNDTKRLSMAQAALNLLRRGGPFALYTGIFVSILGSVPSVAIYFGVYQFFKGQFTILFGRQWIAFAIAVSAALANCIASCFRVPCEIVKQRLQAGVYPNIGTALSSMYEKGGLRSFFDPVGLLAQMLRDVPYAVVTLLTYEALNSLACSWRIKKLKAKDRRLATGSLIAADKPSIAGKPGAVKWESLAIGALAGGVGTLVTTPLDVIKTRLMVSPDVYSGVGDVIWKTLEAEGPGGLMKGAAPRLLHKVPQNSIFFLVYDSLRRSLGLDRDRPAAAE